VIVSFTSVNLNDVVDDDDDRLFSELGRNIAFVSEESRDISFLFQCISLSIQRINCLTAR